MWGIIQDTADHPSTIYLVKATSLHATFVVSYTVLGQSQTNQTHRNSRFRKHQVMRVQVQKRTTSTPAQLVKCKLMVVQQKELEHIKQMISATDSDKELKYQGREVDGIEN
ncbi:hypothetical protein BaRGS_00022539 [Batillaria attramentaria]|uniref:Uncharacterized protein n=1 Tax=Batillaria attramentaria TaxID=370345 RepID=A0ABD0KGW6_9CAEN